MIFDRQKRLEIDKKQSSLFYQVENQLKSIDEQESIAKEIEKPFNNSIMARIRQMQDTRNRSEDPEIIRICTKEINFLKTKQNENRKNSQK